MNGWKDFKTGWTSVDVCSGQPMTVCWRHKSRSIPGTTKE